MRGHGQRCVKHYRSWEFQKRNLCVNAELLSNKLVKFVNWVNAKDDVYYHPFTEPQGFNKVDPAPYWQSVVEPTCSFSEAVSFQQYLCEQGLAPKTIANKEYEVIANYGYHLDAAKFIALITKALY